MEEKFINKLKVYLGTPEKDRDLTEGATLLLQMNKNRILHQNILRNPQRYAAKLFHELGKFLKIYSDNMTIAGIAEMEKQVPVIEEKLKNIAGITAPSGEIALGKREDHDSLPESIKTLWVQNGELARLMKSLHEKLKLMVDKLPCDRYEVLKQLVDTDKKYRENWAKYDDFVLPPATKGTSAEMIVEGSSKAAAIDANRVSANRKFISLNKGKVAKYKEANDLPKYHGMLEKIQERYDELKAAGCDLGEKQLSELAELGLKP